MNFLYGTTGVVSAAYMSIINAGTLDTPTSTIYSNTTTNTFTATLLATTALTSFLAIMTESATTTQTYLTTLSGATSTAYIACSRTSARAPRTMDTLLHSLENVPMYPKRFCNEFHCWGSRYDSSSAHWSMVSDLRTLVATLSLYWDRAGVYKIYKGVAGILLSLLFSHSMFLHHPRYRSVWPTLPT